MGIIKSLLDTDVYKFYMQQVAFHQYPNTKVKYQFVCRNKDVDLSPYIEEIREEVNKVGSLSISNEEIKYLRSLKKKKQIFKEDYLSFLKTYRMNPKEVNLFIKDRQLNIEATGTWLSSIHWEIYILSIVNEVYFRNTQKNADLTEGRKRLQDKIELVKEVNKEKVELLFSEFGTRRRFSRDWQEEMTLTLKKELLNNGFMGSSNVYLSMKMGNDPIGTSAHEFLQAFQAVGAGKNEDSYFTSQERSLKAWIKEYDQDLLIALSDIYGTDAFLSIFSKELSERFTGLRQDSGDPIEWVDKVINHYQSHNIDPLTKTVVFSDGLDFPKAKKILSYTKGKVNSFFGIGTNLSNDLGFKALNIVMKMVECNGKPVVKISDEPSKGIGSLEVRERIQSYFKHKLNKVSKKEILIEAQKALGSDILVKEWLSRKNPSLGGEKPKDLLLKDPAMVMEVLLRIKHGIYS